MRRRIAALAAALLSAALPAAAQIERVPRNVAHLTVVNLPCTYGASDIGRSYVVTNNLSVPIPAGKKVWAESTSETPAGRAEITLQNALNPGQTTGLMFLAHTNGGQCKAWFPAGPPDLEIVSAQIVTSTGPNGVTVNRAKVDVRNNSPFRNAASSTTKVEFMRCVNVLLGSTTIPTGQVPKGGTITISKIVTLPAGYQINNDYLRTTADSTGAVSESNEGNNVANYLGTCVH